MEIIPLPEWQQVVEKLFSEKGTGIIIGSTDSGKSTFARFLIRQLLHHNLSVCLVDSDIGQSSIGLPGTICMKRFRNLDDLKNPIYESMSFIGIVNPAKRIPEVIKATKRMSRICSKDSEVILIDTCGLVTGEAGKTLKTGKIRELQPDHIIALQRSDELEPVLALVTQGNIFRIKTSEAAKYRTLSMRTAYRKKKFEEYFSRSSISEFLVSLNEVKCMYQNRHLFLKEGDFAQGTLIGLNRNEDTLGLGILEDLSGTSMTFMAPLSSIREINMIIFGDLTMP